MGVSGDVYLQWSVWVWIGEVHGGGGGVGVV